MNTFKRFSFLLLLLCLPLWAFCQPIFTTTQANLSNTVAQIQQVYGSQINLSSTAIEAFLLPFVQNAASESLCPPPVPEIQQIGGGVVSFSWAPISQAGSYGLYYLNLNTGSNSFTNSSATGINYTGLQGLYLFGFFSNCGGSSGLYSGPSNVLIVDADVLFPDAVPLTCTCDHFDATVLYNGTGEPASSYNYFWPAGECSNQRYRLQVDGILGGESIYHSDLSFIHRASSNAIEVQPSCDNNATSSAEDPYHVGSVYETDYYSLHFYTDKVVLSFPPSALALGNLSMEACDCKTGDNIFSPKIAAAFSNKLEAFPNPGSDFTVLTYELAENSKAQIVVYDLLGRVVEELLPPTRLAKGRYQLEIDLSNWPKGIYTCRLSTSHFNQCLLLRKE